MATIYDVAKLAGVSVSTVSRTFNHTGYVRDAVRRKVIRTAERLNYTPQQTARRDTVTILVRGLATLTRGSYESFLISHIVRALTELHIRFALVPTSDMNTVARSFSMGIIGIVGTRAEILGLGKVKNVPVVMINRQLEGVTSVYTDHGCPVEQAVSHLVKRGHRRIAWLTRPGKLSGPSGRRMAAYVKSMKRNKAEYTPRMVFRSKGNSELVECCARILKAGATAVIAEGEDRALELMHAIDLLDRKVPNDISVISYENPSVSRFLSPPHTTIEQPLEEMARTGVRMLHDIMNGKAGPGEHVEIPSRFIERESVGKSS